MGIRVSILVFFLCIQVVQAAQCNISHNDYTIESEEVSDLPKKINKLTSITVCESFSENDSYSQVKSKLEIIVANQANAVMHIKDRHEMGSALNACEPTKTSKALIISFAGTGAFNPRTHALLAQVVKCEEFQKLPDKFKKNIYSIFQEELKKENSAFTKWSGIDKGIMSTFITDPELNSQAKSFDFAIFASEESELIANPENVNWKTLSNIPEEIKKLMAELDEVVGKVKDAIANIEGARKNRDDKKVSEYLDSYESYKAYAIKVSANISDLERSKKVYDQLQVAIKEYDSRAYAHTSDEVKKLTSELQAHLGKAEDTVTIFEAARAKGDEKTAASYLNSYEGAREGALKVAEEISKIEGTTKVYDEVKEAINNYDSRVKTPAPSEEIKKLMAELEEHILKTQYTLKDIEASRAKGDDKAISSLLRTYETVKKYALDTSKKISDKKFLEVENDFKGYDSKAYASDSKAAKR